MPIDPIGKKSGIPPHVPGASGPSGAAPTTAFGVEASKGVAKAEAADAVTGASALEQLRAGKIDLNHYVELKLDEATAHLKGLHASELSQVREVLRGKLVQDPHLVDLVRQATGRVPTPPEE
jgi:hypothetical protein